MNFTNRFGRNMFVIFFQPPEAANQRTWIWLQESQTISFFCKWKQTMNPMQNSMAILMSMFFLFNSCATLPKTNSSPLQMVPSFSKGKACFPTTIFQGRADSFRECNQKFHQKFHPLDSLGGHNGQRSYKITIPPQKTSLSRIARNKMYV